ncbi:MAG: ArnT family glycosyltransferase [Lachnospiraceae bacterium]
MSKIMGISIKICIFCISFVLLYLIIQDYKKRHELGKNDQKFLVRSVILIQLFVCFLLFKLSTVPNLFVDEANCMYDSWCIANYGVDSNLIKNPVYLQSFWGQGQSVLYAYMAVPFLKIFDYDLFAFRLPLVLCSIGVVILLFFILLQKWKPGQVFLCMVVLVTSPWLFNTTRWGMDCNVAPYVFFLGVGIFYLGVQKKKTGLELVGTICFGLTAYAYNVAWIFLPFFLMCLFAAMLAKKKISWKKFGLLSLVLIVEIMPIFIFAIRSNVADWNETVRILFWTSPKLQTGRVGASFIDLHHSIIKNMLNNLRQGFQMFWNGSDQLSWNSISGYGAYYLFALPFFIVGFLKQIKEKSFFNWMICSVYIGMIPVMLLVTPNFNHWIFLHFAVLLTIGIGVIEICGDKKIIWNAATVTYLIAAVSFLNTYFHSDRFTGWQISNAETLKELHTDTYEKVYFDQIEVIMLRAFLPASPEEFQKTKDHPYSQEELSSDTKYLNFEKLQDQTTVEPNSMALIPTENMEQWANVTAQMQCEKSITLEGKEFLVYVTP